LEILNIDKSPWWKQPIIVSSPKHNEQNIQTKNAMQLLGVVLLTEGVLEAEVKLVAFEGFLKTGSLFTRRTSLAIAAISVYFLSSLTYFSRRLLVLQ
jgi:hypothetical protein